MSIDRQRLRQLRQAALASVTEHYKKLGLTWIDDVPLVVPITGACENVSTLYRLEGHPGRYLTQTGQLSLEVELQCHEAVYCAIASFRADGPDARHLNEFRLVEEEFTCDSVGVHSAEYDPQEMVDQLLGRITMAVRAMLVGVLAEKRNLNALGVDPAPIELAVEVAEKETTWPVITYHAALDLLNESGQFGTLNFGIDLGPAHEAAVIKLVSRERGWEAVPVFVSHYPEGIKFFNMKVDPKDPAVVLSVDLLLPTAGEAVGGAVREDQHAILARRLECSPMLRQLVAVGDHTIDDFGQYLQLIASGQVRPHAGYGIGLERVLQCVLGEGDIRDVSGNELLLAELRR